MNACDEILGPSLRRGLGDAPAVICGERCLSFADLDRLTARFAGALRQAGVARGDRVLLVLNDTPELVAAWLGAIRIGAVSVALNVRGSAKDLAFTLSDTAARAVLVDPAYLDTYRQAESACRHRPAAVIHAGAFDAFLTAPPVTECEAMAEGDMAFWMYTSGTTGTPKAAVHCHRDVRIGDLHLKANLGVGPGDRLFASSKLFFAFALGHCLIGGLRAGAAIILHPGWPDAAEVAALVERHRPAVMFSVPTFYRNLLRENLAGGEGFRAVRHYVSAGEKLPEIIHERWRQATGKPVLEGIGTTETVFLMIANTPGAWQIGATGKPMPWVEVELRDDSDRPVTRPDTPGILWVRMESLCDGYWNQPGKTAQAFRDGWYRTGDMFSFDADGWWYHHGRGDEMLKISGQWVSPAEIEEVALATPGVADAAVVGAPNEDGLIRLALFAVASDPREQEAVLARRIQEHIMALLSIYKCPRTIRIVEEIPRTATGKIQRFRLRQIIAGDDDCAA